ncbi:MAG: riboflavin synthase [bacterium]
MFTGLIEEIGIVKSITAYEKGAVIRVTCSKILSDLKIGDSVAINGACQTVTKLDDNGFEAEAAYETLKLTNFNDFNNGTNVNLERALRLDSRLGGHLVSGHVEGVGEFIKKIKEGLAEIFYFAIPDNIERYAVLKGSITVNGVSLTITSISNNVFTISVIPETVRATNFQYLKAGDKVNLEPDIIAKYIEKFMNSNNKKDDKITMSYLAEHGFLG